MSEKTYRITADTSQAIKNFNKLADVMTKVGSMPDGFQKSVYNALNKAQKDIVKYGNDVSKLGVVFSTLNQNIQKALDFHKVEGLPSAIKERFKDISKEAENTTTTITKLQNKMNELSRSAGLTYQSIYSMSSSLGQLRKSATDVSNQISVQSNSITSLANASIKAANDISKLSLDTERFRSISKNLENDLTGVNDRVQNLSTKTRNAKANVEVLRVESTRLKDIFKQLEEMKLEIRGIEKAKANLEDLKNKHKQAITVSKENRMVLQELEKQYSSNQQKLSLYINKYDELGNKIKNLKNAGANVPTSLLDTYERMGKAVKEIAAEMKNVEKSIVSAKNKQEQLNATANNMKNALGRLSTENKISDTTLAHYKEMVLNLESQYRKTKEATNAAKAYNSEMAKQSGVLGLVGTQFRSLIYDLNAVRIAFVLLSSSTGILSAIKVIADFDKSMARVRSLMLGAGEATNTLNVEFKALSDTVMALGATTKFTAGQVAEGAVIITQAGYDAKESIDVLKPTLDLAVAGQIEMSEAADTLTKTIAMFQKQTSEAAHVADIYAAAVNYSQTNMSELANAMTYVGPVAETFGLSLEETAGYLAVLANNGISASKAGTSLRQLMMNIQQPTAKATQVLNAYGLNLKDLQRQGMSAEQALRHILTTLSEAGRLGGVVRVTALPAAESLGKSGDRIAEMLGLLEEVDDYAKKVAENNMDNLTDQFIQLVSAVQDTIIKFGEFSGLTDGLTNMFKSGADGIRSWNVDMADLITDLGLLGGVLFALRGRWKSYSDAVKNAQNGQANYNGIVTRTQAVFTGFKNKINEVNDSIFKYKQSLQGTTLATKAVGTAAKIASIPIAAMAIEMAAFTAVMYAISKAVEHFMSNDIDDVLQNNTDLIKLASQATVESTKAYEDYKKAIDAVAASAKQMNEIQLTGKIEEAKTNIKQVQKELINVIQDMRYELSDINREASKAMAGMFFQSSLSGLTDEQIDFVYETTREQFNILKDLTSAVQSGDEEEIANIMANVDIGALQQLSEMIGFDNIIPSVTKIDELSSAFKAFNDELKAMQGEMDNKALAKFNVDLSKLLDNLTLIRELSKTNLTEVFAGAGAGSVNKIAEMDRFIPIDSFRNMYNEILKVENGGKELANVLDFSREKGFFFNRGDLEAELDYLRKQLELYEKVRQGYEKMNNEQGMMEYAAKYDKLQQTITLLESYGTELDSLNQSAFQENFLKIWQEAAEKVDTDKIEKIAESIFKVTEATDDFRENFAKNMGVDFLAMGKEMGLLNEGDISLGRTFEGIRIDSQPVYDYVNAMKEKIAADLEDSKITEQQYKNALRYLDVLPDLMKASYDKSKGKSRRKREDDFYLIYLQSEVAIGNTTDALNGYNEQLLKTYELEKRMRDLQERNPKGGYYYNEAIESLKIQQEVIKAQMQAKTVYEPNRKEINNLQKTWGATGIDTKALDVNREYLDVLEKTKALELARSDARLKNNADIIKNMEAQLNLEKQQYEIKNKMYALESVGNQAEMVTSINKLKSGGWLQNQADWKANQIKFDSQIEMINEQIEEVAGRITTLSSQTSTSIFESGEIERLQLLRQELELRKELLELQKQANNPSGWEGAKQAFREYAQTVGNDAVLMKDAITQSLDSISSGLTEGLYAAMKGTEYNWSQFWDNLAKIFLQKAIEMTVMRGMSALFNGISGLFGGNMFSGGTTALEGTWDKIGSAFGLGSFGMKTHAKGGIIKSPTYMMGSDGLHQAGERGAEAIMPLKRLSGGQLGISAEGAGGGNVNNNDFSIHITTTGSSGNAEQDRKQAEELQRLVKMTVNQQIGEFQKKQYRQGGMHYSKK